MLNAPRIIDRFEQKVAPSLVLDLDDPKVWDHPSARLSGVLVNGGFIITERARRQVDPHALTFAAHRRGVEPGAAIHVWRL